MVSSDSDHSHISSQHPLIIFPPGTLNSLMIPEFQNATHKFKGVSGVVNRDNPLALMKRYYLENAMQNNMTHLTTMVWTGVCFRVDQGGQKAGKRVKIHSWVDKIFDQPADKLQLPEVITQLQVWIPELWFGKVPEKMGDIEEGKHQYDIDRLPTFYSLDKNIPVPNVGQLIQVRFHNPDHLDMGGQYIKLLSDVPGLVSINTLNSAKDALEKKCAGLGPVVGSGASIQKDNMAVGNVGPDLPKFPMSSLAKSFAFGNKASCRGTHRKWYSKLEKHGLVGGSSTGFTHYEKFLGNGIMEAADRDSAGRETILFFPSRERNYVKLKPEIMFFFHDKGGFYDGDFDKIAAALAELNKEKRNYIFVITELPWSRGINVSQRKKRANDSLSVFAEGPFDKFFNSPKAAGASGAAVTAALDSMTEEQKIHDPGHWPLYQKQVMKIINGYVTKWSKEELGGSPEEPFSRITFIALGAGGLAVKNAIDQGADPWHIVMSNADHIEGGHVQEIIGEYIQKKGGRSIVVMTDGLGSLTNPLSKQSVEVFKARGFKTPSTLNDAGFSFTSVGNGSSASIIAFSGFDALMKNSIVWTNDAKFPHEFKYFAKNDSDHPEAIEAAMSKPKVPATLGQAINIPEKPPTPPKPQDALEGDEKKQFDAWQLIKKEVNKAIQVFEARYKGKFKDGNYSAADELTIQIKESKDELIDIDKNIDELLKPHQPKEKPGSSLENPPNPGCPDAKAIGTVGGSEVLNQTKAKANKAPWTPIEYDAKNFKGGGNSMLPSNAPVSAGVSPGPQKKDGESTTANNTKKATSSSGTYQAPEQKAFNKKKKKCKEEGLSYNECFGIG